MATQVYKCEQDWQKSCSEIKQRGAHLLRNGVWSDCTFLVGPQRIAFSAHRLILAMASPIFEAMFYGSTANSTSISIPDVQPETFQSLLEYIYSDEIKIKSFNSACNLLTVAHKYMLHHVEDACTAYMSSNLTPDNACRNYETALLFNKTELMTKALEMMSRRSKEVLRSKLFEKAQLSTVVKLFSLNELDIDTELDLMDAAERYARAQENAQVSELPGRPSIRSAVQQIRFLTLTTEQLTKQLAEYETTLLTQLESYAIIMNTSSKKTNVPMPKGFSANRNKRNKISTSKFEFDPILQSQSHTHMKNSECKSDLSVNRALCIAASRSTPQYSVSLTPQKTPPTYTDINQYQNEELPAWHILPGLH